MGRASHRDLHGHLGDGNRWSTLIMDCLRALWDRACRAPSPRWRRGWLCLATVELFGDNGGLCARRVRGALGHSAGVAASRRAPRAWPTYGIHGGEDRMSIRCRVSEHGVAGRCAGRWFGDGRAHRWAGGRGCRVAALSTLWQCTRAVRIIPNVKLIGQRAWVHCAVHCSAMNTLPRRARCGP